MPTNITNVENAVAASNAFAEQANEAAALHQTYASAERMKNDLERWKRLGAVIDQAHIDAIHLAIVNFADKDRLDASEAETERIFVAATKEDHDPLPPRPTGEDEPGR